MEQRVVQEDVFRHGIHARGLSDAVFQTATRANDYLITVRALIQDTFGGRVPPAAVAPLLLGVCGRCELTTGANTLGPPTAGGVRLQSV